MLRDIKQNKLFYSLITIGLFLSFAFNVFGAVTSESFKLNFKDSEALVSNQIVCKNGLFNGQLLEPKGESSGVVSTCAGSNLAPYSSQFGLQGKILGFGYQLVDTVASGFSTSVFIALSQLLTAFLSAALFALLIVWVKTKYGTTVAILTFAFIALSPMLVGFGRNLYWALPLMIAPFIFSIYYYRPDLKPRLKIAFWVILGTLFYLRYLTGYEYITTLTIMVFAAVAYTLYINKVQLKNYIQAAGLVLGVSVVAFCMAMATHIGALTIYTGSVHASIQKITQRAEERTINGGDYTHYPYGNLKAIAPSFYEATDEYVNYEKRMDSGSLVLATLVSAMTYLLIPVIHLPIELNQSLGLYVQSTVVFVIILGILFVTRKKWLPPKMIRDIEALYVGLSIGIVGYLSWLVLAFSHSLVHAHINGILLYLPTALFGFIILAIFIHQGVVRLKRKRTS